MASFEKAIENHLEGIELDVTTINDNNIIQVWLTKDGNLAILHGGDNGELNHHFKLDETVYIFDKTYKELQTYDMGEGYCIPTLEQLIAFIDKRTYINIEVKAPHDLRVREKYDFKTSVAKVYELIQKYDIEKHCGVSSFDHDVLAEIA